MVERSTGEVRRCRKVREIKSERGRTFILGVYCPCCMGGNYYRVGHVIFDCDCFCIPKEPADQKEVGIYLTLAQRHKRDFLQVEKEHHKLRDDSRVSISPKHSFGLESCRRFINDGGRRCRVEYGICQMEECGGCYQRYRRWKWRQPFVDLGIQLRWVRVFFQNVALPLLSGVTTVVATVGARKGKKKWKMGEGVVVPSGALVEPGPEELWFRCQLGFPTERRVERRV